MNKQLKYTISIDGDEGALKGESANSIQELLDALESYRGKVDEVFGAWIFETETKMVLAHHERNAHHYLEPEGIPKEFSERKGEFYFHKDNVDELSGHPGQTAESE